ncbi:MAG TPA: hypothetical protein VN151_15205 [Terracidiphilus sp.]|nr:hypothetical protein [Terracidiphilus sp.]
MVRHALYLLSTLVFSIAPLNAAPADSVTAFVGKWKLDPAHSRLTDQMKVEPAGPNRYNLIFSADNVETIVADGTDQPALFGSTLAIVVQDASNWKIVRKSNGRTTIIGLWKLSPDGKALTDDYTSYRENGTTMNLHYVYQRISDGSGFVGTWESTTDWSARRILYQRESSEKLV